MTQRYDHALRDVGFSTGQFTILSTLAQLHSTHPKGVRLGQLAEKLMLDRTTLTRNLEPLKRRGLIRSMPGEDRRLHLIALTEKGDQEIRVALKLWEEVQSSILDKFGEERWQDLRDLLQELSRL